MRTRNFETKSTAVLCWKPRLKICEEDAKMCEEVLVLVSFVLQIFIMWRIYE